MEFRNPRDTRAVFEHTGITPTAPGSLLSRGEPGRPHSWVGNHVTLQWKVTIPAMAPGADADFSGAYPDKAFVHGSDPWLELFDYGGYPLLITGAYVMSAANLGLASPGTFADIGLGLQAFSSDLADKTTHWYEFGGAQLDPTAGSQYTAARLSTNLQGTLPLQYTFPKLGFRATNLDGSPSLSGQVLIVVEALECGQPYP